jgi:hypothetical protein
MPERWATIWCSHATNTPKRDAIRSARSGSEAPTSMAETPTGETETGTAGASAANPVTVPAVIVASALIAALHSHSESPPHSAHTTSKSFSEARDPTNSSDSAGDHRRPASRARSRRQAPRARSSDHGPPSPGAGENSWRYSPEPRQITGVIDPSIAVSPTTALPSRASRPTLALSGSGVRCPRRPRRLRRTPPTQPGTSSDPSAPPSRFERTAHQFTQARSTRGPLKLARLPNFSLPCAVRFVLPCPSQFPAIGFVWLLFRRPSYRHPIRFRATSLVEDSRTSPPRQGHFPPFVRHWAWPHPAPVRGVFLGPRRSGGWQDDV